MDEFLWLASPFDNDDDDFSFEEGHAELAAEIREYADDDDDEFDEDERAGLHSPPRALPAGPTPAKVSARKKVAAKPAVTKALVRKTGVSKTVSKPPAKQIAKKK